MTAMVVLFTSAAVLSDLRTRRIPNWLTVPSLALALVAHGVHGLMAPGCYGLLVHGGFARLDGLVFSLLGFAAGFGVLFLLLLVGGGGGGDVKMMAALGAWLGWELTLAVFLGSAVVTVVLSAGRIVYLLMARIAAGSADASATGERTSRRVARESLKWWSERKRRFPIPYAVPVAVSTWVILALVLTGLWKWGTLP